MEFYQEQKIYIRKENSQHLFCKSLLQFHLMDNISGSTSDGPLLVGYIFLYVVPKYYYRSVPS